MIRPGEIQRIARGAGVRDQQIEKDYILSWILSGIARHDQLSGIMAFKGGTVLKKFYFDDYRFSEDLDFTLLDDQVSKGMSADDFHSKLEVRMPQYKSRWKTTLGEQIHGLPDFEQVEREVTRHLKKLQKR
jgi:predicted nucleotidyltransferase component of viral defense system